MRKSSKILGKPDEYINASNSLSCLTQSLNSVFQLNFDHSILFTLHACIYNFTLTTNLISFTWRPSKALESLSQAPGKALSFILLPALADQRSAPN